VLVCWVRVLCLCYVRRAIGLCASVLCCELVTSYSVMCKCVVTVFLLCKVGLAIM
jgi:hypothetical protein